MLPTSLQIYKIYDSCQWERLDTVKLAIEVEPGRMHLLHRIRLGEHKLRIARWLLHVNDGIQRTKVHKLVPWRIASRLCGGMHLSDKATEQMLAMGAALGFVTINIRQLDSVDTPQGFAVIEDDIIRNYITAEERRGAYNRMIKSKQKREASPTPPKEGLTDIEK